MSELEILVLIMRENTLFSGEIYTATKHFALPLVLSVVKSYLWSRRCKSKAITPFGRGFTTFKAGCAMSFAKENSMLCDHSPLGSDHYSNLLLILADENSIYYGWQEILFLFRDTFL